MSKTITLNALRQANVARCNQHSPNNLYDWSPAEWGCALAGEVGEFCNLLKKLRRGDNVNPRDLQDEAGDILTYLDLASARLGFDLDLATVRKFNEVSVRFDSTIQLGYHNYIIEKELHRPYLD